MRSRGLVVAIAVVLAVAAAAAVVLYTQGIKDGVGTGATVIVANQDIPPNTQLQPLVDQGVFSEIEIPEEALVANALTTTEGLEAATTTQQIFANEQIPVSRLSTSDERVNNLGISEGHMAVSVEIDAPQGGLGTIQPGDLVQVFATYQSVSVIPVSLQQYIRQPASQTAAPQKQLPPFTLTLIPNVKVLKIQNPPVDVETGRSDSSRIQVTFDLLPEDAQNLVFAQENARIWLGLLPPEEEGTSPKPSTVPLELLLQGARRA
ncbi:MAG TPA: Flp pilus assembly protein CpaB [Actinomycetota bacterium]|jgi:pilus assembly protein CpaB|nr:Flp pilus assembly protein CpaB [Actinomycetota bacterium]